MTTQWANWLSREMTRQGWTTADAARALGVGSAVMSKWSRGLTAPDLESCRRIAENLNRPLLEILVGAGRLTAEEAGQKPLQDLDWDEISSVELIAELQNRLERLQSEVDELRGNRSEDVDRPKGPVGLDVPGIPIKRPRAGASRHLK